MILTDYIVLLALAVCICAWWKRGPASRTKWLVVSALVLILAGVWSILDDRWQAGVAIAPAVLILLGLLIGHKWPRKGTPWISGTLLILLVSVAYLAIYFFPVANLPAPSGEYAVGVRDFELRDASRPGLMVAGPEDPRRLLVRVWYPAGQTQGFNRRPYFAASEVDTTAVSIGRFLNAPFAFKYLKHVKTNSYQDAPLETGMDDLPVIIYSHGYTSFAGQNTALMEELASHGYVVYSVQHTFDSAPTVFPNGDVLDSDPALMKELQKLAVPTEAMKQGFVGATFAERRAGQIESHREAIAANQRIAARSTRIWTDDRIFLLDQLQAGTVPEDVKEIVVAGNFEHTGQIGMSFGGSTTGEFCFIDSRCAAGVNLDGGDFHFSSFGQNQPTPFLMMYSDFQNIARMLSSDPNSKGHGFNDFSYERPETAGFRSDVVRLQVGSVTHLGVSDFTLFMRSPLRNPLFGSIRSQDMIQIQNDFVLGFFDTHVRIKENNFPEAQFDRHKAWVQRQDMTALREDWLKSNPDDQTVQVMLETSAGEIEVALYPKRAPISVANFLTHVDGGHYDGASFYRVTRLASGTTIGVVQGGLAESRGMGLNLQNIVASDSAFPPIAHETTDRTGIANETGTLAMARLAPGTASSEFFFNVEDNPALDFGNTSRNPDGQGYATFGRVLRGLPVLWNIQAMRSERSTDVEFLKGQMLNEPVIIHRAYRVK